MTEEEEYFNVYNTIRPNGTLIVHESSDEIFVPSNFRFTRLTVYVAVTVSLVLAVLTRSAIFVSTCTKASLNFHDTMYDAITRTTMYFFNVNSSGKYTTGQHRWCVDWTTRLFLQNSFLILEHFSRSTIIHVPVRVPWKPAILTEHLISIDIRQQSTSTSFAHFLSFTRNFQLIRCSIFRTWLKFASQFKHLSHVNYLLDRTLV